MAVADILLLSPIEGLGAEGDQVRVRLGYARNFLLRQKKAILLTRANQKYIEALRSARTVREAKELEGAQDLLARLQRIQIALAVKTGEGGRMFGSITGQDLLNRLKEEGIVLEKRQLLLHHPIKTLGKHTVKVKLHATVTCDFSFEIVSENPIIEE